MIALKKKLEKYKSREWMTAGDEVLLEEIKVYKVRYITFPSWYNVPSCVSRLNSIVHAVVLVRKTQSSPSVSMSSALSASGTVMILD